MPMAPGPPPPLFCFKKMGSATFLGVILSNWATPWTEQTCGGGNAHAAAGSRCSPGVIHTHTMRHRLDGAALDAARFDEPLGRPPAAAVP